MRVLEGMVAYLASESGRTCWFAGSPSKLVRSFTSVLYMLCARFTHIDLNVGCLTGTQGVSRPEYMRRGTGRTLWPGS